MNLYALVSRMRVLSSSKDVESADAIVRRIIATYSSRTRPSRPQDIVEKDTMDPLREFSNACREELRERRLR